MSIVNICGTDCLPGHPNCNGYCIGQAEHPKKYMHPIKIDYWESMYNAQCQCTDKWVTKYRAEVERKADATLQARCDELLQVAANANSMIGKERDQVVKLQAKVVMLRDALQKLVDAHGRDFDLSDYMPLMIRALEQSK